MFTRKIAGIGEVTKTVYNWVTTPGVQVGGKYFDGGRFSITTEKLDLKSYYNLNIQSGVLNKIKETDDFDYLLLINEDSIMKVFFFPNDNFPNGVEQIFKIYTAEDKLFSELLSELDISEEAVIY